MHMQGKLNSQENSLQLKKGVFCISHIHKWMKSKVFRILCCISRCARVEDVSIEHAALIVIHGMITERNNTSEEVGL